MLVQRDHEEGGPGSAVRDLKYIQLTSIIHGSARHCGCWERPMPGFVSLRIAEPTIQASSRAKRDWLGPRQREASPNLIR